MDIGAYRRIKSESDRLGVQLIAVSKLRTEEEIMELYREGHRDFGENRAGELLGKVQNLPSDIRWHMIGNLQTKKVKKVVPFVYMIQSCDRWKLAGEIQKQAARADRSIPVLLEMKIAAEETKSGFGFDELREGLSEGRLAEYPNLDVQGLMAMATFTEDMERVRTEFHSLAGFFEELKTGFFADQPGFRHISMGMSGDYRVALEEGSTMVRLGTILFGPRPTE